MSAQTYDPWGVTFSTYLKALVDTRPFEVLVVERRLHGQYLTRCSGCGVPYITGYDDLMKMFDDARARTITLSCSCGTNMLLEKGKLPPSPPAVGEKTKTGWLRSFLTRSGG